jgi:very-short-patch-repair endonuclease
MSKGSEELLEIVQQLFPNQRIELEHNIANRGALFLDIYLPRLKIAFEYDGQQHFAYNEHFHGNRENFLKARRRDAEKDELCDQQGITLIRVAYNEEVTKISISNKIMEALCG